VRGGYLHDEPADALVAEVLSDVEAGEPRPQPQGQGPPLPMSEKQRLSGLVLTTWNIGRWGRLDVQNFGAARL
jgi:hypothetical protein